MKEESVADGWSLLGQAHQELLQNFDIALRVDCLPQELLVDDSTSVHEKHKKNLQS